MEKYTVCPQFSSGQRWNAGAESLVDTVLGSNNNDPQRPSTLAAVGKDYTLYKQSHFVAFCSRDSNFLSSFLHSPIFLLQNTCKPQSVSVLSTVLAAFSQSWDGGTRSLLLSVMWQSGLTTLYQRAPENH